MSEELVENQRKSGTIDILVRACQRAKPGVATGMSDLLQNMVSSRLRHA